MSSAKRIQTVLGPIDPSAAGVTLTHEHLSLDIRYFTQEVQPPDNLKHLKDLPYNLENLHELKNYPYYNVDNLRLDTEKEAILQELKFFKAKGGSTMVDNTTYGMKRDTIALRDFSKQTGINIVAGAGYFSEHSFKALPHIVAMTTEELSCVIMADMTKGCDGMEVKCGVIGEVGCTWPITDFERRSLQASAEVQSLLGCPVIIHPDKHRESPLEVARILQEAGCDLKKTVMSHLESG